MAIETTPGLFGARADERLALPPAAIEAMLARIAAQLYGDLTASARATAAPTNVARFEQRAVEQLRRAGADSLVVAGAEPVAAQPRARPPPEPAPRRLRPHARRDRAARRRRGAPGSLAELTEAIGAGAVDTLLVVGGNPAYDAPGRRRVRRRAGPRAVQRPPRASTPTRRRGAAAGSCRRRTTTSSGATRSATTAARR